MMEAVPQMARALYNRAVVAARSQLLDGSAHDDRACAADCRQAPGGVVCGGHSRIVCAWRAGEIYIVADSLVVASMVGGSGHGAGASYAGYTDHMDSLDAVFTYGQASCVPPRVRERLPKDPLGHLPRPLIVRLGDGSKDYTMSLHHP